MTQSMVELAKELTLALVQTGKIPPAAIPDMLQQTHATLTALKGQEEARIPAPVSASHTAVVDWRKSISKHAITCLECGHAFKQLSNRHLGMHELDTRSYRMKYAIPRTQPLAARTTTDRRRQAVRETRPWEQAPRYRKSQAQNGQPAPAPAAETVPDETDVQAAAAPAHAKGQRKTTRKKQTARKKSPQG